MIIVLFGVSGTGKSTIGKLLSKRMNWTFADADDFHSEQNINKMASGQPLNDSDRKPWLESINHYLQNSCKENKSIVLACSALKAKYRDIISHNISQLHFVHLFDSYDLIYKRMQNRKNHFMSAKMLQSQFDTLEHCKPDRGNCYIQSIVQTPELIVNQIMLRLQLIPVQHSKVIVTDLMFPEAPRWHDNKLWFTDQHAQMIMTSDIQGNTELIAKTPDLPGGLGWLQDGSLIVVYMTQRKLYRLSNGQLSLYADLSQYASFHCNDMIMDNKDNIWVGNFGYDVNAGADIKPAEIIHINPQAKISIATDNVIFPNGCVLSEDKTKLIVAETFASRLSQFDINPDGSLTNGIIWADLGDAHPDGICWAGDGDIWVAAPNKGEVWKVKQGGQVSQIIKTHKAPYACMLGGDNNNTLFIASSGTSNPQQAKKLKSGCIEICQISY